MVEKLSFCDKVRIICEIYNKEHKQTFSEEEMDAIEKSLQISFPKSLREFYLTVGADAAILKCMYKIAAPRELYVEDNTIMLAVEYQNVCGYGIDIETKRPVYFDISNNIKELLELDIEDFLLYLLAIQGTEYLPCVGKIGIEAAYKLEKSMFRLSNTEKDNAVFCSREGIIGVIAGKDVFLSARTDACMELLEIECELEIDYL